MRAVSVLLKPASGQCNIKCEYCFYMDIAAHRDRADFGRMSEQTLEAIVKEVFACAEEEASFSFQGGEPTLRGLDFFRLFVALVEKYNVKGIAVHHALQTNGLLLDEAWAAFLRENHFLVGLSLDGPQEVHDRYRCGADGKGTYRQVMKTAALLNRFAVEYNILFTVTAPAAQNPGKLYTFFKKNDFHYLQFMPCMDPLARTRGTEDFSLRPQEFLFFLERFFDRWSADVLAGDGISVRYFDNLVSLAAGLPAEACSMRGACACQFIFEADGSCYPCDFYVTERWNMGNIREKSLAQLYGSEACMEFLRSGSLTAGECAQCKWRSVCRGGCRHDRDEENRRNYFCRAYAGFFDRCWPKIAQTSAFLVNRARQQGGQR